MKFLHGLRHGLLVCSFMYENWWIEIQNGKKLMRGERCVHCGKLIDIQPTGIELEYEKL